jgi:hypothetical protein
VSKNACRYPVLVFAGILLTGVGCKGPQGAQGPPGPAGPPGAIRTYYLTKTGFNGQQAATACASGYHMASLWEIFQTAALQYNTTLGRASDDSGAGPPSNIVGWIRTGNPSSNSNNCSAWTSSAHADTGAALALLFQEGSSQNFAPWFESAIPACDTSQSVWCVSS